MTMKPAKTYAMADDTESVICSLVSDLRPVVPLRPRRLWVLAIAWTSLAAICVIVIYGARTEWANATIASLPNTPGVIGKPALFAGLGVLGLIQMIALSRPSGRANTFVTLAMIMIFATLLGRLSFEVSTAGPVEVFKGLIGANLPCAATILIGGCVGFVGLWAVWLRRCASAEPGSLAAFGGLATASLTAAAYAIHCNMDAPVYLVGMYATSIFAVALMGQLIGRHYLQW